MMPNPWLLAALIVTATSAAIWAFKAGPWRDTKPRHPGAALIDEIEAYLQETRK